MAYRCVVEVKEGTGRYEKTNACHNTSSVVVVVLDA